MPPSNFFTGRFVSERPASPRRPNHEGGLSGRAIESLKDAPANVRRAFGKQFRFLAINLLHPSLHAKKYDEAKDLWQARVNKDWRSYFTIADDTYRIEKIIPHPK
jgi:mRNA interferase RelE/StbE